MVRLARKVFELQQRGRALDARADAQTRDARALDDTRRLIGAEPDRRLQTLATRPLAVGSRPDAIPGASAVTADPHDSRTVQAALDQMTNVALRQTLSATRDGVRICGDEPVLRKDLGRAAKLLEFAADQRGYDPDGDTHDPRRATDPSRARLHTDTESLRIHVTRRDSQRQRVRDDPRVAHVTDICAALGSPRLFLEDTLVALDVMAVDLLERLAEAEATGRRLPHAQQLRQLHDALVATASAARKLDDLATA
jgi:hypothetical protein